MLSSTPAHTAYITCAQEQVQPRQVRTAKVTAGTGSMLLCWRQDSDKAQLKGTPLKPQTHKLVKSSYLVLDASMQYHVFVVL